MQTTISKESIDFRRAIECATKEATRKGIEMLVLHAPVENREKVAQGGSIYGYCPAFAADIMFPHALTGTSPSKGVLAHIDSYGTVVQWSR